MKRVLIVDDGAFMRSLIKGIVERNGYEVVGEAVDGESGVRMYKVLNPDLVTMDITMPLKDGLEALKEIIEYDGNANVLMVSSMGQENYVREAISTGAKSFIVKPFDESSLISIINAM